MKKILKIIFIGIILFITIKTLRSVVAPTIDKVIFTVMRKPVTDLYDIKTQNQCEALGGDWGRAGIFPKEFCRFPFKDYNSDCFAGFQCQAGICITKADLKKEKIFSFGKCPKYKMIFGCIQQVHFGLTNNWICYD